jgi:hypothetical protein
MQLIINTTATAVNVQDCSKLQYGGQLISKMARKIKGKKRMHEWMIKQNSLVQRVMLDVAMKR